MGEPVREGDLVRVTTVAEGVAQYYGGPEGGGFYLGQGSVYVPGYGRQNMVENPYVSRTIEILGRTTRKLRVGDKPNSEAEFGSLPVGTVLSFKSRRVPPNTAHRIVKTDGGWLVLAGDARGRILASGSLSWEYTSLSREYTIEFIPED